MHIELTESHFSNSSTAKAVPLSPEESVKEKYNDVYDAIFGAVSGTFTIRHVFIGGDGGVGKTYTVNKAVDAGIRANPNNKLKKVSASGSIGNSMTNIVAFLFKNKDDKVIILDDCDGFLLNGSQEVFNTLKIALNPPGSTTITVPKSIMKNVAGVLADDPEFMAPGSESMKESFFNRWEKDNGDDEEKSDKDSRAVKEFAGKSNEKKGQDSTAPELPASFDFNSYIVFVSNVNAETLAGINEGAISSRVIKVFLTLTYKEFIAKLNEIEGRENGKGKALERLVKPNKEQIIWLSQYPDAVAVWDIIENEVVQLVEEFLAAAEDKKKWNGQILDVKIKPQFRLVIELFNRYWAQMQGTVKRMFPDLKYETSQDKAQYWTTVYKNIDSILDAVSNKFASTTLVSYFSGAQ